LQWFWNDGEQGGLYDCGEVLCDVARLKTAGGGQRVVSAVDTPICVELWSHRWQCDGQRERCVCVSAVASWARHPGLAATPSR